MIPDREFARRLEVSVDAVQATRECGVVDLHIDTFIPMRMFGYDVQRRHQVKASVLGGRFIGHLDLPRIMDGGLVGAMWSVTTNPFRSRGGRWQTAIRNFRRLRKTVAAMSTHCRVVASHSEYLQARADGAHAVLLSIQGGNALDGAPGDDPRPDPALLRVTLVHLTNSAVGASSQPAQLLPVRGLSARGRELVRRLNAHRVFVDLAHISPQGFWDAMEVHDRTQPVLVTHTGVVGVYSHWRNLDDAQLRAVADTGGVIGIMFHAGYLGDWRHRHRPLVVDHLAHVIETVGEDHVALGSDYDGMIIPPPALRSGDSYPRLVQQMLDRRWSSARIEKVLGGNFLRSLRALRPQ